MLLFANFFELWNMNFEIVQSVACFLKKKSLKSRLELIQKGRNWAWRIYSFAFFRRESIDLKAGIFDLKAGKIAVKVPQKTCENSVHIIVWKKRRR